MAAYSATIDSVRKALNNTFHDIDPWFFKPAELLFYKPKNNGWAIGEILEHITLTSHFLLIVIRNGTLKAQKRALLRGLPSEGESDLTALDAIGLRGTFEWKRPEHMVPTGKPGLQAIREKMQQQHQECLSLLEQLCLGRGALFTANMSVNRSGRLDLYQWLYFLAQHAKRHIAQMKAVEEEATNE